MPRELPSITGVAVGADALEVRFERHDRALRYPWKWVRDHGEDAASRDPVTGQRLVDTFAIPADLTAHRATASPSGVLVEWGDGAPPTELSAELLADVAGLIVAPSKQLWGAGTRPDPLPVLDHGEVVGSDVGVLAWLEAVERLGFGLVRGMPPTRDAAIELASRVAAPRHTIFGDVWALSPDVTDHADSAYGRHFLEPHTDGAYSHDAPGLQLFACLERGGVGGESVLVDGFAATERLRAEAPERYDVLTRVAVPGRYVEPGVDLRATRPTIGLDGAGAVRQITMNNYDRAAFLLPPDEMTAWYDAYAHLHRLVTDRAHWLLLRLEPGDVVLFDNWRTLHGRMGYTGPRVFVGCYHNREDFESRLRVLRR